MSLNLPKTVRMFLVAHGASAFATGVHQVLLAWLAIGHLHLPSQQVGWVQAAGLLPNLVFMLIAGALADRRNPVDIMAMAQGFLACCFASLALALHTESLSLPLLMVYACAVGMGNAFVQPVREKIIGELSEQSLQLKITRASFVQFLLQSAGISAAAFSEHLGLVPLVITQSLVAALAAVQMLLLRAAMGETHHSLSPDPNNTRLALGNLIVRGLQVIRSDSRIAQLMLLISFNGFLHMGLYLVAIPILARDSYRMTAVQYGFLQFGFVAGMLGAYLVLMRKSHIGFPGQGALFSLLYTAIAGYGLSRSPTLTGLYLLIIFWGWVAGYSSTHCRLVLQSIARPQEKGRLMSLYQLLLFGMAPLGALVTGHLLPRVPVTTLFFAMSVASVSLFVLFLFSRALWSVEQAQA